MSELSPDRPQEAEKRIAEAFDRQSTRLNLRGLNLRELPDDVWRLRSLRALDISRNSLSHLPEALGSLDSLERVDASGNRLTTLPTGLVLLRNLRELDVAHNRIEALPRSISRLRRLVALDAGSNTLRSVPPSIGEVPSLRRLILFNNQLTELPASIGRLRGLVALSLSRNALGRLPEWLVSLRRLESLTAHAIGMAELPDWLQHFGKLRYLAIGGNPLRRLPGWIGGLRELIGLDASNGHIHILNWESTTSTWSRRGPVENAGQLSELPISLRALASLRELYLHGNPHLQIPEEILGPGWEEQRRVEAPAQAVAPSAVLEYYFRTQRGRRRLNEAKLILVGRGGVGKTSLIKRLIHNSFDQQERETPGIEIQPWSVTVPSGDEVRLHVWDFGGQEILHATHQFFLTERTLYLLVLSGREGNPTADAEYWLQLIRSFGGDSPVIVALNKSRQHPFDVNRGLLLEKYPFIVDFVRTDCEDATGCSELLRRVLELTDALEHRKADFPADWFHIKERLAGMSENYLSWDDYQRLCVSLGEHDAASQRDLASYLHILGIALNYRDDPRLRDTHVLNPGWVTEGIYALLRAGNHVHAPAVLQRKDLAAVLDSTRYPEACHDFLLHLMEKFQLCFRLPGREERYLVPELLGENQPDLRALLEAPGLGFRYQYEVLPEGLLPRFIVQTHRHSDGNPGWRWRTGVVLQREGCTAVVRADARERRVDVHIAGPETRRRDLLAVVREKFDEQHRDLKGLTVDERVPVLGQRDVTISYRHLLQLEEDGETHYRPEGMRSHVSVADLLNGVESSDERAQRRATSVTTHLRAQDDIRQETPPNQREPMRAQDKCRLLFLAANPEGTTHLALEEESREIAHKVRASDLRDLLEQVTRWAVRPDDLLQYLNEFRPHIVHFSGHGSSSEEIILLDSTRKPKPVSKEALRAVFGTLRDNVRVVVLNACFSKPQAEAIVEVIDCAIGMRQAIGDRAATTFAAAFYRAIGFGHSVQRAFDEGIAALLLEGIPEAETPELLVRSGVSASDVYVLAARGAGQNVL